MFDNTISMFRMVSLGTVTEHKGRTSNIIQVTPHEKFPFMDGDVSGTSIELEYDTVNQRGQAKGGVIDVSSSQTAIWLPSPNRVTPPDVRVGEKVELWQMAGTDTYYWRAMGKDERLRTLETVVIGIAANPDDNADGRDPENMYFIELSSHNKTITLNTSQKNGEAFMYTMQFDMDEGRVVLCDDQGMSALFDSANMNMRWENPLGSFFEMNKRDFSVDVPNNVSVDAGQNIDVKAGNNINVKAANTLVLDGGGSVMTLKASGTTLKTPSFKGGS